MKNIVCSLLGILILWACGKKDGTDPAPVPTSVETLQAAATFPVGASIDPGLLVNNALYKDILLKELSSITVENAMKWSWIHPQQNTYNFTESDNIADFAKTNGKRLYGHNLLWHAYNPAWLTAFQGDSAAWENLMKTHIQTVVAHFKGKVAAWDVVNEAFRDDDGTLRMDDRNSGDGSIWARKIGKDYLARAFQYAHQADPDALLFYNDYGQENNPVKTQGILKMVEDFKKRGVPISGLGLQMHIYTYGDSTGITRAISDYAKTGLKVHLSELDINISNFDKNLNPIYTDAIKTAQRQRYKFVVQTYKKLVPVAQQAGITTWNVGDADSWLRSFIRQNEYPLLFDEKYQKKPAYYGFLDGLKN